MSVTLGPPETVRAAGRPRLRGSAPARRDLHGRVDVGAAGRELAAGAVDLAAAGVAHRDGDAADLEATDELVLVATARGRPPRARGRVQRDEVHVHPAPRATPPQHLGELLGPLRLVVHVADEDVLD